MDNGQLHGTGTEFKAQDSISRLPDEIILEIAEHLFMKDEYDSSRHLETKVDQSYTLLSGKKTIVSIYRHDPKSPIQTDFQSFALVIRTIYSICRPIIWQSLTFSHEISRPMSFWNREILPKHGCYVRALDVTLNSEWCQETNTLSIKRAREARKKETYRYTLQSSNLDEIKFFENCNRWDMYGADALRFSELSRHTQLELLEVEHDIVLIDQDGICPEDLVTLLSHCDQLTTLYLNCPGCYRGYPSTGDFRSNLASLFPELGHLQHFKIIGHLESPTPAGCIINPISRLPLLESLECANISLTGPGQVDGLATSISSFKNLKQLVLELVDAIDGSWGDQEGPPKLVSLTIRNCTKLRLSDTPRFISSWAPRLTHLELKFGEHSHHGPHPIPQNHYSKSNPDSDRFSLPSLTHLTIWPHAESNYIHCFADCQNLSSLMFYLPTARETPSSDDSSDALTDLSVELSDRIPDELSDLSKFITTNVFPKLKVITLLSDDYIDGFATKHIPDSTLFPLTEICKSMGIKLR